MKRLLCAALVLLMGVAPAIAMSTEESMSVEQILWDIPFGIDMEECIALVIERTGVELELSIDERKAVEFSSPSDELRVLDCPVNILTEFDGEGMRAIMAEYFDYLKGGEEFTAAYLQLALEMIERAEQSYGEARGGIVTIDWGYWDDTYSLPVPNGVPDKNTLGEIFTDNTVFFSVTYFYDEASITIALSRRIDEGISGFLIAVGRDSLEYMYRELEGSDDIREYLKSKEEGMER